MLLQEYIPDQDKLRSYIVDGIVTRRPHASLPLDIYCYGKRATYDQIWDDVTCKTRGLIVERGTGKIIARPFEKFFNLNTERFPETMDTFLRSLPYTNSYDHSPITFTEKLDGSLGILYQYEEQVAVATKGSFHSEHAEWATDKYKSRKDPGLYVWPEGYTPIFELICEGVQHHVVHYGEDKIVLLALINTETGEELTHEYVRMWAWCNNMEAAGFHAIDLTEAQIDRPNTEGYVATVYRAGTTPLRVKIKHDEFLRLQYIHHHTTPKTVFKAVRDGDTQTVADTLRDSDQFLARQVDEWIFNYMRAYGDVFITASNIVAEALQRCTTRKEFAAFFLEPDNKAFSAICFNIIDQDSSTKAIWDFVENTGIVQQQKYDSIEEE